jgi:RHS repeat-associated protein
VVERDRNGDNDSSTGNRGKSGSGLEQRTYALQDANWNTTAVVLVHDDDWVELVDRILYDPYGAPTFLYSDWTPDTNYAASVSSWIYLPQGGRYDPVTGLVDKRNRVYSTSLGRPVQTDPKGYPDGLNRYQWEGSNPISRLDSSGESWLGDKWESVKSAANTLANSADSWVLTAKMLMTNEEVQNSFTEHLDEDMHDGALAAINGLTGVEIFGDDWMYDPCNPMLQYSEDLGKFASAMLQLAAGIDAADADMCLFNSCFLAGTPVLLGDGQSKEAIDQIHVGQRVATDGGVANSADGKTAFADPTHTDVDPKTWRLIKVQSDDGDWQVQTLVPLKWLRQHHAHTGGEIYLSEVTDVKEMGVPEDLEGSILSIGACPQIEDGPGRVVLTTVNHSNNFVYTLTLTDSDGRADSIGITGYHRVYTEDRGWVIASQLVQGEVVRTAEGDAVVSGLVRNPGVFRVYNMTVESDHVYYVGDLSALVHNSGPEIEEHHLLMQQFYGENPGPLQDLPVDLHDWLHEDIADAITDEFWGEGAPNAYNGGRAAWQDFFASNDGAFERVDEVIKDVTSAFMKDIGLW